MEKTQIGVTFEETYIKIGLIIKNNKLQEITYKTNWTICIYYLIFVVILTIKKKSYCILMKLIKTYK